MRIAFDQQIFLLQEYGGISRYICGLAKDLSRTSDVSVKIIAPLHYNSHLAQLDNTGLVWGWRVPRIPKTLGLVSCSSDRVARSVMKRFRPDIVHETYFSTADYAPKRARRLVSVYDMITERVPSSFSKSGAMTAAKRAAMLRADHVICISQSTRRDLLELFDLPEEKVSVVYLGYDALPISDVRDTEVAEPPRAPYLLYVGNRGGYKNFEGLLRAFASSPFLRSYLAIICFGGGEFTMSEAALIDTLGLKSPQVQQIGGGDDVLARLYQRAEAFIYPSRYEGFGIPPLEAMSMGCPVICSDTSSLPEVVGEAGEYFDPADPESIRAAIETVVQSESRRAELVAKGRTRCAVFSWAECARQTMAIYRSLL